MRKKVYGKALSRARKSRKALFRSIARALIIHGSIETTQAKAKASVPFLEKLITLAKKDDLSSTRRIVAYMNDKEAALKLIAIYKNNKRASGFVKTTELMPRRGDMAKMVKMELLDFELPKKDEVSKESKKAKKGKSKK
jgi:large subunit ribosomal protein L17